MLNIIFARPVRPGCRMNTAPAVRRCRLLGIAGQPGKHAGALRRTIVQAVERRDLRSDTDAKQRVAEIYALMLGLIHTCGHAATH